MPSTRAPRSNMNDATRFELQNLLSSLCDQQLTDSEQIRLEGLLHDQECRRVYLEYLDLHSQLIINAQLRPILTSADTRDFPDVFDRVIPVAHGHSEPGRRQGRGLVYYQFFLVAVATLTATI